MLGGLSVSYLGAIGRAENGELEESYKMQGSSLDNVDSAVVPYMWFGMMRDFGF